MKKYIASVPLKDLCEEGRPVLEGSRLSGLKIPYGVGSNSRDSSTVEFLSDRITNLEKADLERSAFKLEYYRHDEHSTYLVPFKTISVEEPAVLVRDVVARLEATLNQYELSDRSHSVREFIEELQAMLVKSPDK